MLIEYKPTGINNFHNSQSISLRITGEEFEGMYVVSKGQYRKIYKHFCGIKDCRCAGGACVQLDPDGNTWGIRKAYCS